MPKLTWHMGDVPLGWHHRRSMQQRLPSLLDPPLTFAHRGARAHARENTLDAFALGLRLGASGLESDVWVTADGVAVLDHDGLVRVGMRRRPIRELTRRQLPAHVPTVGELIDRCGAEYHLSLDLKDETALDPLLGAVREAAPALEERLWLCHPSLPVLTALRARTHAKLVDSTRLAKIGEGTERRANTLRDEGIDAINMHQSDWTGGLAVLFHRFERYAFGWDLQQPRLLRQAFRMGLDGLYSDHVDRMQEAFTDEIGGGRADL